jgi:hypothetical protein
MARTEEVYAKAVQVIHQRAIHCTASALPKNSGQPTMAKELE